MDEGIYPVVRLYDIPYSEKLSGEKTFTNFAVLWLFAKVFSAKFGGVVPLVLQKQAICESFLPRKFPAIQYCIYYDVHSLLYSLFSAHQEQAPRRSYKQTETVGDKRLQTDTL